MLKSFTLSFVLTQSSDNHTNANCTLFEIPFLGRNNKLKAEIEEAIAELDAKIDKFGKNEVKPASKKVEKEVKQTKADLEKERDDLKADLKEIKSDIKQDWNVFEAKVWKKIAKIKEAVNS